MQTLIVWVACGLVLGAAASQELLQNGEFESLDHWNCLSPVRCALVADKHSGANALEVEGRETVWQGPSQYINATRGTVYQVSGYMKLLNDNGVGQNVEVKVQFEMRDGTLEHRTAASLEGAMVKNGWFHLIGIFRVPNKDVVRTRIFFGGPDAGVSFVVDDASVTHAVPCCCSCRDV